jgi:hypothetical protein
LGGDFLICSCIAVSIPTQKRGKCHVNQNEKVFHQLQVDLFWPVHLFGQVAVNREKYEWGIYKLNQFKLLK